jgi:phosphoribosylformimino-5-aminoimidazole carboxamide ribotide isomerase
VDIMGGRVVSLVRGEANAPTYWGISPVDAAKRWEREGADGLHIVDLDRALGSGSNERVVHEVLKASGIPVQVGGGIRTVGDALRLLAMGANRLVVGTLAYSSPSALRELVETTGADSVAVAADYREGRVVTHGWTRSGTMALLEAVEYAQNSGVRALVVTATEKDGTAAGPDVETYGRLRKATKLTILASGGVRSEEDIESLAKLGVDGVILGRGLYDGSIAISGVDKKLP